MYTFIGTKVFFKLNHLDMSKINGGINSTFVDYYIPINLYSNCDIKGRLEKVIMRLDNLGNRF